MSVWPRSGDYATRFWAKVDKTGDCWLWKAGRSGGGYGVAALPGDYRRATSAHRIAYELEVGPIPPGHHVHHVCRNRACVNPAHLRAMTPSSHKRETAAASRVCRNGRHIRSGGNLLVLANGSRVCRACWTLSKAAAHERRARAMRREGLLLDKAYAAEAAA